MALSSNTRGMARIVRRVEGVPGESHIGMAFIVGPRQVMTCCHVLNDALGRTDRREPKRPAEDACFVIRFPYADNAERSGLVEMWGWESPTPQDVVVLSLEQDAPAAAGLAAFSDAEVRGEKWSCVGWDAGGFQREVDGILGSVLSSGERQLNGSVAGVAPTITGGYSGAAVWCEAVQAFVGMVVTSDVYQNENRLAYAVPASLLRQSWRELPKIPRPGSAPVQPVRFEVEPASPKFVERRDLMRKLEQIASCLPRRPAQQHPDTQSFESKKTSRRSRKGSRATTRVALHGPGGAGKTKIVAAFARANEARFPDGVLWGTAGNTPDVRGILSDWGRALGDRDVGSDGYPNVATATRSLTSVLRSKRCLLILDDAWDPNVVRDAFQIEGPSCLFIVTTRRKAVGEVIGAEIVDVAGMTVREGMTLLRNWAGAIPARSRDLAQSIAKEVDFLPLALELIGAQVKRLGWSEYKRRWDQHRLEVLKRAPDAKGKQDSANDSIDLSVATLENEKSAQFYDLAVFPDKAIFPAAACAALWNCDEAAALNLVLDFEDRALLQKRTNFDPPRFIFHDLVREFVRERRKARGDLRSAHQSIVDGYKGRCPAGWSTLSDDGYVHDRIAYHMASAEDIGSLRSLLTKPWFQLQTRRTGSFWAAAADLDTAISFVRAKNPSDFCDLFKWCYARAILGSRVTVVPPRLLGALVRLGQTVRAREYAALIGAAERRASAYLRMAAAARDSAEPDVAAEFCRQAHSALDEIQGSGRLIPLAADLAHIARAIGDESMVDVAVAELMREAQTAVNDYWAVRNVLAAARPLVSLGRKKEAAAMARSAVERADLDTDKISRVAFLVGLSSILRKCDCEDEARAVDVKAEDAFQAANQSVKDEEGGYVSLRAAFDLVLSFIDSNDVDSALIVADRWVIGGDSWDYPHALSRVSAALLSVGRREEAAAVAGRALDAAKEAIASELELYEFKKEDRTESLVATATALAECGNSTAATQFGREIEPPDTRAALLAAVAEVLAASPDSTEMARALVEKCMEISESISSTSIAEAAALANMAQHLARMKAETEARRTTGYAEAILRAVNERDWEWQNTAIEVAKAFALLGDIQGAQAAIATSESGVSAPSTSRNARLDVAETLEDAGLSTEATALAVEALEAVGPLRQRSEPNLLVRVARLLGRSGDVQRALDYAHRAQDVLTDARRPFGTAEQSEFDEAIAGVTAIIDAYSPSHEGLWFEGKSFADDSNQDIASRAEWKIEILRRVIQVLWECGASARAIEVAQSLVALSSSHRIMLAEAYERAGAHAKAEEVARTLLQEGWPVTGSGVWTTSRGPSRRM